jgi:ATP adenylyltransferase/5',5'''-P-1,P-4-tetraphosphate phosphorylase II
VNGHSPPELSGPAPPPLANWRVILDTIATIAIIVAAATLIWQNSARPAGPSRQPRLLQIPREPILVEGKRTLGNENAKAVMIEFADFE